MTKIKLPVMQCDDGCGDCCGVVPVTTKEYRQVTEYAAAHMIVPQDNGATCPFYQGGKCAVYEVRPWICQAFGHAPMLTCSRGYNTNALTERKMRRMAREQGKPSKTLHDVLGEGASASAIAEAFGVAL